MAFTIAPRTTLLTAMWWAGKAFPRSDRSPAIQPHRAEALRRELTLAGSGAMLTEHGRISRGFYISQAMEARG